MDIIMIRHGETQDNLKKRYSRDTVELTSKGIKQVKDTRELIKDLNFNRVYYSPLERTKQTMLLLKLDGKPDARIREIDFGIFKGLDYQAIVNKYPYESSMWFNDPVNYIVPEGESLRLAYSRLKDFLEELVEEDGNILLVAHEGIIRLVCCWAFNSIDYFFKFKADNGSISIVSLVDNYKYISKLNISKAIR